jgi:hypothetical protein
MGRAATALVAAVVGGTLLCVAGLALFTGAAAGCVPDTASSSPAASASAASAPTDTAPTGLAGRYDRDQLANAATIVSVGIGRGIPARGLVIAVAAALQESALRNLGTATDHDSLGLFQQRPSQGWGSPDQLMDPVYATNAFYTKLLTVPNWQRLPLTDAAQAVQRSAYPAAYTKWEPDATALVALSTGPTRDCTSGDGTSGDGPPGAGVSLPAGFTLPPNTPLPVTIAIWWALRQLGTPTASAGTAPTRTPATPPTSATAPVSSNRPTAPPASACRGLPATNNTPAPRSPPSPMPSPETSCSCPAATAHPATPATSASTWDRSC